MESRLTSRLTSTREQYKSYAETTHTNSGSVIECTHKYLFEDTGNWSLCSDNAYTPGSHHEEFDRRKHAGHSFGKLLTDFNFANTTTVLQRLEGMWRLRVYTVKSMTGHAPYTMSGSRGLIVDYTEPLVEIPCNPAFRRLTETPASMSGGLVMYTVPCGGNLLNEGHLEQIVNHAMHIVYTEGPRSVEGAGFKVEYEDSGGDFASSNTRITIWFYFNGYPICVKFRRQRAQGDDSPCALIIRPAGPSFVFAVPPPRIKGVVCVNELGERLYSLIAARVPPRAGKITGMLLTGMDDDELFHLLESPDALNAKIAVAIAALQEQAAGENERGSDERRERERQAHIAVVEANDALQKQEAKVAELKRKLQASQSRAAKAAAPPMPYTARQEPPRSKKAEKKQARKDKRHNKYQSMEAQLEHEVHTSEEQRALRAESFNIRQMVIQAEADERKAKERLEAAKKLKADMSAEYEAAVHVVPQRSTLSAIIGEALDAAVM